MNALKKQSATGVLAAILIGLLVGFPLHWSVVSTSERQRRSSEKQLSDAIALNEKITKWDRDAKRGILPTW